MLGKTLGKPFEVRRTQTAGIATKEYLGILENVVLLESWSEPPTVIGGKYDIVYVLAQVLSGEMHQKAVYGFCSYDASTSTLKEVERIEVPLTPVNDAKLGDGKNVHGGWSDFHKLDADEKSVFEEIQSQLIGVAYTPEVVSVQIVAGTNYHFVGNAKAMIKEGQEYFFEIWASKPLDGKVEVTKITTYYKGFRS